MQRHIGALADREFDLLVVGGGVYGAAVAWEATLRDLSGALIEKGDFGGATSFNNLKTIHGGIRYLQHADWRRMRESIRERRILMRVAPHLVHPLPFLVPTYRGSLKQGRTALKTALLLNDLVSLDRNRGADPEKHLPRGRLLSPAECRALVPGLESEGLTGGALWYDAQMYNSDRLTLSFVLSAAERGAVVANHVEATGFVRSGNRITGVRARDRLDGDDELEIRAKLVVNATGPWVDRLLDSLGGARRPRLFAFSKAMNLITGPLLGDVALGVTSKRPHADEDAWIDKGGRFLCLSPWRGVTLIATSHAPYHGEPDRLEAAEEDVNALIADVNDAYPGAGLARDQVRLVHRGLLPMVPASANGRGVTLVKSFRLEDHRREGVEGLLTIVGVKYTTARDVAEKAVDRVARILGRGGPRGLSRTTPLRGGAIDSYSDFLSQGLKHNPAGVEEPSMRRLLFTYGTGYREILTVIEKEPHLGQPVVPGGSVLRGEVRHAVREEMALDLASVVLRRTELGAAGHPGREALETCAAIVQSELGWSEGRKSDELESLESFYRLRS